MKRIIAILIVIVMMLFVACDSETSEKENGTVKDTNKETNMELESTVDENSSEEVTSDTRVETVDSLAQIMNIEELQKENISVYRYHHYCFYHANGKWYTAQTNIENNNTVEEITVVDAFDVTADNLKEIKVGMDVCEVVKTAGIFSDYAANGTKLIFEANDGSYAVVYFTLATSEEGYWKLIVDYVSLRSADEVKDDLYEGMLISSIPYDATKYKYRDYVFFEYNGRWCALEQKDDVITKAEYYESYNVTSEYLATVEVGMTVYEAVEIAGIPSSAIVDGETVLLFETVDGKNAAVTLDSEGEKIESVAYDVEYLVKEKEKYSTLVERLGDRGKDVGSGAIIYKWTLSDERVLTVWFKTPDDIDEPKYPDDLYVNSFKLE